MISLDKNHVKQTAAISKSAYLFGFRKCNSIKQFNMLHELTQSQILHFLNGKKTFWLNVHM